MSAILVGAGLVAGCRAEPSSSVAAAERTASPPAELAPPRVRLARGDPFTCYEIAHDATALTADEAGALCSGAMTTAPVDCFQAARSRTTLLLDDALALCRCAASEAPVDCFVRGREQTSLSASEVAALCAAVRTGVAPGCSGLY